MSAATHDGRTLRLLTLLDEYKRECLAIRVARGLGSQEVIETLADSMVVRGVPGYLRSDNGPEFVAETCGSGWRVWGLEHCKSTREVRGRTATVKVSTGSCGMNA